MMLHMESPSPNIDSMHLELGMEGLLFTDPIDDFPMLVATPTSGTHLQDNADMSYGHVGSRSQLNWFAQKRGSASEIDSAETAPLHYRRRSSKHAKVNSWNISFGHPHSFSDSAPSISGGCSRKRSSLYKQRPAGEGILADVENQSYRNVESTQKLIYQSKIEDLGASGSEGNCVMSVTTDSIKKCLGSSLFPISKEEPFSLNSEFGKDACTPSKNGSHVMAERRRRERLNQKFIALSAIVPGLKKADKATILSDAVNYVKRLEEQLQALEDQVPKSVNSAALRNSDEGLSNYSPIQGLKKDEFEGLQQPDIEARLVGKNVLIHVHCGKIESVLVKALEELENLRLSVVNASVLSFSNKAIDLTFTAQIEEDCKLTADDIAKALHIFFRGLIK